MLAGPYEAFPVDPRLPEPYFAINQGVTAHHGMVDIARVREGDVVFVSGAAGGVGSLAGQVAKALGASRVIGSAGSAAKCIYLTEVLGYDAAINYRDGRVLADLREAAPEGVDVVFDTVGGEQFEAAVQAAAPGARLALCGALSGQLDDGPGAHPRLDVMTAIAKDLVILPFTTMHTPEQLQAWNSAYGSWLAEGALIYPHTLVSGGLQAAPVVLDELLAGTHRGNVLVQVAT
ncbi:zinc-binding dehydrogenase [Modestobacter caceresii]|uniref:zinc-binding dehydrogenase n=1 Tax=Modestobacter caceresii TaxID=1522368 RepID=UPI00068DBA2F|nr:zinc-binding dehydrogenase [Modestobacter caceresii]